MNNKIPFLISLILFLTSSFLLVTGSGLLVKPLMPGSDMPWGTIITWIGLIALPALIYFGIGKIRYSGNTIFRILNIANKLAIIFSSIWGFLSYYLANNWAFVFEQQTGFRGSLRASSYFRNFTIFIIIIPLTILIFYFTYIIIKKFKCKSF